MKIENLWYQDFNIPNWHKPILKQVQETGKINFRTDLPILENDTWLSYSEAIEYFKHRTSNKNHSNWSIFMRENREYSYIDNSGGTRGRKLNANYLERVLFLKQLITDLNTRNYYALTEYEMGLDLDKHFLINEVLMKNTKTTKYDWYNLFNQTFFIIENSFTSMKFVAMKPLFYKISCKYLNQNGIEVEF